LTDPNIRHAGPENVSQGETGRNGSPNCVIKPKLLPTGLPRIPDRNDLLRISDRLALSLRALSFLAGSGCGALALLCSTVRSHRGEAIRPKASAARMEHAKRDSGQNSLTIRS
jgi:hypothetical protein